MVRHLHVVPHTHWDREWYEPFPVFRARLVELLDEVLDRLDGSDPAHPLEHFQLDGQMAMVDDYLEVRPAERDRIQQLAGAGRLSMGPWYVLPDEFLVSGETLVRNLQLGMARADELGRPMPVGYLPDMFGHVAAMPQLLTLFGMQDAVVWRGVPASVRSPAFDWRSPDGSVVRAEYLSGGYFNGSDMPADPAELADRVALFAASQGSLVGDRVLWLAGMDHEVPPAHLATTVAGLAGVDDRATPDVVTIGPLTEAFVDVERDGLPVHDGELRSGARANLLMGVASNRVDVKAAAANAERSLERLAEPLDALWQQDDRWAPLLRIAWREVIRNAAHDSICACSHDEVVDAVLHRYAEATRTAHEVARRALDRAAASFAAPGTYLVNPTQHARDELVTVTVDASSVDLATMQVVDREPDSEVLHRGGAGDAPLLLARELLFERPAVRAARLVPVVGTDDDHLRVELYEGVRPGELEGVLAPADALGEVGRRCDHDPEIVVSTVLHRARPRATALAMSGPVAGFGWRRWSGPEPVRPVVATGDTTLANGLITVTVDADDGTFSIGSLRGLGRLVDGGDAGDTYNWCPPQHDLVVEAPARLALHVAESGPLRGRLVIDAEYELPERVGHDEDGRTRREGGVAQRVTTTVELRAAEPFVRVTIELGHHVRDHRLRAHLPLPRRAHDSTAECAFGLVQRPLWAEGGPNEWGVATFPSRRFVRAGGLTVTHDGLCEYELVDLDGEAEDPTTTAGELALTLVRATGWLSRGPMASRPLPAGPEQPLEGPQLRGPLTLRYAVATDDIDPYELADRVWSPLAAVEADGGGERGEEGTGLDVRGVAVDAVARDGHHVMVRGHEPFGRPGALLVPGRTGEVVDLLGRSLGGFDTSMALRPHQIVTVRLDPPTADRSTSGRLHR